MRFMITSGLVLPVLFAGYVGYMLFHYAQGRRYTPLQYATVTAFAIYLLAVVHYTLLPIYVFDVDLSGMFRYFPHWNLNFVPFSRLFPRDFVLNVALFVPLGFLLPLLLVRYESLARIARVGLLLTVAIEGLQFLLMMVFGSGRGVDVNDVIANTLGAVLGYGLLRLALRTGPLRDALLRARLPIG